MVADLAKLNKFSEIKRNLAQEVSERNHVDFTHIIMIIFSYKTMCFFLLYFVDRKSLNVSIRVQHIILVIWRRGAGGVGGGGQIRFQVL